jgi:hypothetical protein
VAIARAEAVSELPVVGKFMKPATPALETKPIEPAPENKPMEPAS